MVGDRYRGVGRPWVPVKGTADHVPVRFIVFERVGS